MKRSLILPFLCLVQSLNQTPASAQITPISQLPSKTTPLALTNLLVVVDQPNVKGGTKNITVSNLFNSSPFQSAVSNVVGGVASNVVINIVNGMVPGMWTNVLQAGVVGGTTNDTPIIQSVLNSAASRGIGVYFPETVSYLVLPLRLTNNVKILGLNSIIKLHTSVASDKLFDGGANTNISIMGVCMDGQNYRGDNITTNRVAVSIYAYGHSVIQNNTIKGFDKGIEPTGDKTTTLSHQSHSIDLLNNTVYSNSIGFYFYSPDGTHVVEYLSCVNNHVFDNGVCGYWVNAGNINILGGECTDNNIGFIYPGSGANNSHGLVSGVKINHNVLAWVACTNITSGQSFLGNDILSSANGYFENCKGINIQNNLLGGMLLWFVKRAGQPFVSGPSTPNYVFENGSQVTLSPGGGGQMTILNYDGSCIHYGNNPLEDRTSSDYGVLWNTNGYAIGAGYNLEGTNSYGFWVSNGVALYLDQNIEGVKNTSLIWPQSGGSVTIAPDGGLYSGAAALQITNTFWWSAINAMLHTNQIVSVGVNASLLEADRSDPTVLNGWVSDGYNFKFKDGKTGNYPFTILDDSPYTITNIGLAGTGDRPLYVSPLGGIFASSGGVSSAFTDTLFVRTNGNNSTAVKGDPGKPWLSISNAVAASSIGDTIDVGTGVFDTGHSLNLKVGSTLRGHGWSTILSNSVTQVGVEGCIVNLASGCVVRDLYIIGTDDAQLQPPLGVYDGASTPAGTAFTNAVLINVRTFADSDAVYVYHANQCSLCAYGCLFEAHWDTLALGGNAASRLEFFNCVFRSAWPSLSSAQSISRVANLYQGQVKFENCELSATNGPTTTTGIGVFHTAAIVDVVNSYIFTGSTNGTILDIDNATNGTVRVSGIGVDKNKTTGTITWPVSVTVAAETVAGTDTNRPLAIFKQPANMATNYAQGQTSADAIQWTINNAGSFGMQSLSVTGSVAVLGPQTNSSTLNVAGPSAISSTLAVGTNQVATSNMFDVSVPVGTPGVAKTVFQVGTNHITYAEAVTVGNGLVSAPSLAFSDGSGVFLASAGVLDIVKQGTAVFQWNGNGSKILSGALAFSGDSRIGEATSGVLKFQNGGNLAGGFYQWGGEARLTTNMTTVGTTLANLGMGSSITLQSGRAYEFTLTLFFNEGLAADGIKIDFGGGAATATTFRAHGNVYGATSGFGGQVTSLTGTIAGVAVSTDDERLVVNGYFVPSSSSTFIPRFAKNADAAGATLTIYAGSNLIMHDVP